MPAFSAVNNPRRKLLGVCEGAIVRGLAFGSGFNFESVFGDGQVVVGCKIGGCGCGVSVFVELPLPLLVVSGGAPIAPIGFVLTGG